MTGENSVVESSDVRTCGIGNCKCLEEKTDIDQAVYEKEYPWKRTPTKVLKITLWLLNVLTVVLCLSIVSAAAVDLQILSRFSTVSRGRNWISDVIVIITVLFGIPLAIWGTVSAVRRKIRGLQVECCGLLVIAFVTFVLATILIADLPNEESILKDRLAESFAKTRSSAEHKEGWDEIHKTFSCCGNLGPMDFGPPSSPLHIPPEVPISCCTNARQNLTSDEEARTRNTCVHQRLYYQHGCQSIVVNHFGVAALNVIGIMTLAAFVMVLTSSAAGGLTLYIKLSNRNKIKTTETDNTLEAP